MSHPRGTPEEIMQRWRDRSTLTDEQLHTAAMDCMDFIASILESGGRLHVAYTKKGRETCYPVQFIIPGITTDGPP